MWFEKGLDNPISDFDDVQTHAVNIAKDGDIFVEVGSFVGESLAVMADKIKASNKKINLYSVDLFDIEEMCKDGNHSLDMVMNATGLTSRKWIEQYGPRCMLAEFYKNLSYNGRDKYLTAALVGRSAKMADLFVDGSVKFCFIDAGHSYENVLADMRAWYPKMKPDGLFAGHDWFSGEEVRKAVIQFAQENKLGIGTTHSSWVLKKI